jgi:hypothetical protein
MNIATRILIDQLKTDLHFNNTNMADLERANISDFDRKIESKRLAENISALHVKIAGLQAKSNKER